MATPRSVCTGNARRLTWSQVSEQANMVTTRHHTISSMLIVLLVSTVGRADSNAINSAAAIHYLAGHAVHILPETTNQESGYFSLSVGNNSKVYVGTAKYGVNAYLVEFDPTTQKQRIVVDVHRQCRLSTTGFQAQAKIHTFNFIAPSGRIYIGSKQGIRTATDSPWDYPGGYILRYIPDTNRTEVLGQVPMRGHGVSDVVTDAAERVAYVTTCSDHTRDGLWYRLDLVNGTFTGLGPTLVLYATTVMNRDGIVFALTADGGIASYNPHSDRVAVRPLPINIPSQGDSPRQSVQYLTIAADGETAYYMDYADARLFRLSLASDHDEIPVEEIGLFIENANRDARPGLHFGPAGRLYTAITADTRIRDETYRLTHLVRYDPISSQFENLGILTVRNSDFFDFDAAIAGQSKRPHHGFQRLPNGMLAAKYACLALAITDHAIYATHLYPFTLLRIAVNRLHER